MNAVVEEITFGPRTRLQAAKVLEQALGTAWVAVLESRGADGTGEWELVVDGLRLIKKPATTDVSADGVAPVYEGGELPLHGPGPLERSG